MGDGEQLLSDSQLHAEQLSGVAVLCDAALEYPLPASRSRIQSGYNVSNMQRYLLPSSVECHPSPDPVFRVGFCFLSLSDTLLSSSCSVSWTHTCILTLGFNLLCAYSGFSSRLELTSGSHLNISHPMTTVLFSWFLKHLY